jgi:hypothetical protein
MGSRIRQCLLLGASAGLTIFASCDQHSVGEVPQLQKEHVFPVTANDHESTAAPGGTPSAKPTPADFFPDSGR